MENVINSPEIAMQTDEFAEDERRLPALTSEHSTEDKPAGHVRIPELRRNSALLTMMIASVIGAGAGARIILGGDADAVKAAVAQTFSGAFGEIFLRQTIMGAAFLCAEFIFGFFAAGDVLVWAAPFFCASGTVLRLAAGSPKLLPGMLIYLGAVTLGAARSAEMSGLLMRLTQGGTVYLGTRPRRSYALSFLGCFAAVLLGAILTGLLGRG